MSRQTHLFMIRPDLEGIAQPALPKGFALRTCRPGDEAAWTEIIRRAYGPFDAAQGRREQGRAGDRPFPCLTPRSQVLSEQDRASGDWPEDAFQRYVLADPSFRPERLFFIVQDSGSRVATAGAFQNLLHGGRTGYVHMMAVLPEFQRRGLGAALLRRCLLHFKQQDWREAVLDTDSARLPAIRLYLANAFEPFPEVEADVEKWRTVLAALGRPDLATKAAFYFRKR